MRDPSVVSIILTTCCESAYRLGLLRVSIENFLRNTEMRRKEWIICDNGDDRQTAYLKTVDCHKHLIFGENRGIVYARNAGAEAATGDYLCFVDGDLVYRYNWIRTLKLMIEKIPHRIISSGILGENVRRSSKYVVEQTLRWQIWRRTCGGCLCMSRQTWNEVGPWPDHWRMGNMFCEQANNAGYDFAIPIPEVAMPLDYAPSYNKKRLMERHEANQEPVWEMIA